MPPVVSLRLVFALLLHFLPGALGNDAFVGERFEFKCGGGGRTGYWNFNGNPIGQSEPTSKYNGTATESLDGIFNCTNLERTVSYASARLKVYGLLGVSPFPSNCSSVDNNTNTCTVTATINSSLTLCVDFVKYPELAKRHAELDQTTWKQVLPGEENILSCFGSQCASPAVGYSYTGDWGRCLHKESVGNNTLISYSIEEVFPPKNYPPNLVHRTVLFNIQVGPNSTPIPTTATTIVFGTPSSVTSSSGSASSVLMSSSATPSIPNEGSAISSDPPTMIRVEIAIGVAILAFVIATVVVIILVAVVVYRRRKTIYCLQKPSDDSILDPDLQQSSTNEGRTRPSDLQIQRARVASSPVTYQSTPQASSQRPLLYQDQNRPQASTSLPPPPPYSLTVNHTNGHGPLPPSHTHPHVVPNGSAPYPRYVVPNRELGGSSQRDSLLELDDIDASPEVHV